MVRLDRGQREQGQLATENENKTRHMTNILFREVIAQPKLNKEKLGLK